MAKRINVWQRSKARRFIMQAIYQFIQNDNDPTDIASSFKAMPSFRKLDENYFDEVFSGIIQEVSMLHNNLDLMLTYDWHKLDPISKSLLMLGSYELIRRSEVPYRTVIQEAINLSKTYGNDEMSYKLVNGVLDAMAQKHRSTEYGARTKYGARNTE